MSMVYFGIALSVVINNNSDIRKKNEEQFYAVLPRLKGLIYK